MAAVRCQRAAENGGKFPEMGALHGQGSGDSFSGRHIMRGKPCFRRVMAGDGSSIEYLEDRKLTKT